MRKILLNLLVVTFLVLLYACNSSDKNAEAKEEKKSNQALNDELQEEHYMLIKEQRKWAEEKDFFQRRLDTLKKIYDKLKPQHEIGYDEVIDKIEGMLVEHFDLITQHTKETESHTELLAKHERNEIDDRQIQDQHRAFYEKHKNMSGKHEEIVGRYQDLIKKVEEFVTKAGGKLPDLSNLKTSKPDSPQVSQDTAKKDTTKK